MRYEAGALSVELPALGDLCASLSTQFEAMQYDWIDLGLQDPGITGTNDPGPAASRSGPANTSGTR